MYDKSYAKKYLNSFKYVNINRFVKHKFITKFCAYGACIIKPYIRLYALKKKKKIYNEKLLLKLSKHKNLRFVFFLYTKESTIEMIQMATSWVRFHEVSYNTNKIY